MLTMVKYRVLTDEDIPEGTYEYRRDPYGGAGGSLTPAQVTTDRSLIDPDSVVAAASKITHVHPTDILGLGRTSAEVQARALVIYALRELAGWSYPRIGEFIDRDHSSVMNLHQRRSALTTIPQRQRMRLLLGVES